MSMKKSPGQNERPVDEARDDIASRFSQNRLIQHPADHQLTDEDRAKVERGDMLVFTGKGIAKEEVACDELGHNEGFWYYIGSSADPYILTDIHIPRQTVTSAHCSVSAHDVLRAARDVDNADCVIVGGSHSHGHADVFSSSIDHQQSEEMAREGAGYCTTSHHVHHGEIQSAEPNEHDVESPVVHVAFSSLNGDIQVELRSKQPLDAADMDVRLLQKVNRTVTFFGTCNARGHHFLPTIVRSACGSCAAASEKKKMSGVEVVIIGPVECSAEEERAVRETVRERVHVAGWGGWYGQQVFTQPSIFQDQGEPVQQPQQTLLPQTSAAAVPEPYAIHQYGRLVGRLSPELLEEAAFKVPQIADALGWETVEPGGPEPGEST